MLIYTYKNCSTCKKALAYLNELGREIENKPIRDTPPSINELRIALAAVGGNIKRLFNTSGQDYRRLNIKETLEGMSDQDALTLLASNGNLIKRPLLIDTNRALVGFKPEEWSLFF